MSKIKNRVDLMPGENLGQCIGAGYEVQIQVFAPLSEQVAERVRGIGRPWSVDVDAADRNLGLDAVAMTVIR